MSPKWYKNFPGLLNFFFLLYLLCFPSFFLQESPLFFPFFEWIWFILSIHCMVSQNTQKTFSHFSIEKSNVYFQSQKTKLMKIGTINNMTANGRKVLGFESQNQNSVFLITQKNTNWERTIILIFFFEIKKPFSISIITTFRSLCKPWNKNTFLHGYLLFIF